MGTTLKLLPVCECGYVFRDLELNHTETLCGWEYLVPFTPSLCPNCNRLIESLTADMHVLKNLGIEKHNEALEV